MLILSYENEFNLHVNEISFSYERMSTKTRFEEEAKSNSEMAYLKTQQSPDILVLCLRKAGAGKSHDYRDVIIFGKLRFQNVFRPR